MLYTSTPTVKKLAPLLNVPVVSDTYREPSTTQQNSTQNRQNNTPKVSLNEQSIIKFLPGFPQDTKPLRTCPENRAKTVLKIHLGIKYHS